MSARSPVLERLLTLAFETAKSGAKKRPAIAPPQRMAPILRFAKLNDRAKETTYKALLEDADFRARVRGKASESSVGPIGIAVLDQSDGWEQQLQRLVEADAEPLAPVVTESVASALTEEIANLERERDALRQQLGDMTASVDALKADVARAHDEVAEAVEAKDAAEQQAQTRTAERQRAVAELKHTESVLARHVAERKRLEQQVNDLVAAQLNTTIEGGGVTDDVVRAHLDLIDESVRAVSVRLAALRDDATPTTQTVDRRTPLPLPPGLLDSSPEAADHLLAIPNMVVLVDGYNVTKTLHDDLPLLQQREWLVNGLRGLAAQSNSSFVVVFDGTDDGSATHRSFPGVDIQFSPGGVEADDVILDRITATAPHQPIAVVSNDRRVRDGSHHRGANLLTVAQLHQLLG